MPGIDPEFGFDYGLGSVIRAIAHWIRSGLSRIASIAMLGKAYKFIPQEEKERASVIAEQLVTVGERFHDLTPDQPLQSIAGSMKLPGNEVYINFRVPWIPMDEAENRDAWAWTTVQWRGPWSTPANEIWQFVYDTAAKTFSSEQSDPGFPGGIGTFELDSLIWFQHPEQL
jgi:hypothetical protein